MMITGVFSVRLAVALGVALAINGSVAFESVAQEAGKAAGEQAAAPTAPALSTEALALKAALTKRFGRDTLAVQGYAALGYKPIWTTADGALSDDGKVLLEILADAANHALPVSKYGSFRAVRTGVVGRFGPCRNTKPISAGRF